MILDDLSNASLYHGSTFEGSLDFLEQADLKGPFPGRHAICGECEWTHQTKKLLWEAHRKHVDVQVVLLGWSG